MKVVYCRKPNLSFDESCLLMKLSIDESCVLMKFIIVKEVMSCDVSPVAMFFWVSPLKVEQMVVHKGMEYTEGMYSSY